MDLILTSDTILHASQYPQQNLYKSHTALKRLWTGNQKRSKMAFFVNLDLLFVISLVVPLKFTPFLQRLIPLAFINS